MATDTFPIKAMILFPLFFYLGFKFAVTGGFGYILTAIAGFFIYVAIKAVTSG